MKVGKDSYLLYVISDLVDVVRLAYQGIDLFEIRLSFNTKDNVPLIFNGIQLTYIVS